jgi:hypothetical protein
MVQPFDGMETPMKTLGIWVALSRDWSAQFKKMVAKGEEASSLLGQCQAFMSAKAMAQQVCTLP